MKKISAYEFEELDDVIIDNNKEPMFVYLSDNEDNPYVGVEYEDGSYSIVGCCTDCEVTFDEMYELLNDWKKNWKVLKKLLTFQK